MYRIIYFIFIYYILYYIKYKNITGINTATGTLLVVFGVDLWSPTPRSWPKKMVYRL